MQYLIVSDLHANWPALEAVLADAGSGYQQIICCGDLVGYNPAPGPVLDWTRQHCTTVIRGNHDKVVAGLEQLDWFNETAQKAARWTIEHLDAAQLSYLAGLPAGPLRLEHFDIWHGSPRDEDEYVTTPHEASACFAHFENVLAFFGHTHLQGGFFSKRGRTGTIRAVRKDENEATFEIEVDILYLVNPGSVGQPRDNDHRAAYALFDSEQKTVTLRRVPYPVQQTAHDIIKAGLPDVLGLRLFRGL